MSHFKISFLIASCLTLGACSTNGNVAVVSKGKAVMQGTYTSTLTGAYYTMTNGRTTCTGAFNTNVNQDPVKVPVMCTNGAKGEAIIHRQLNGYDGYGKITLDNGETADIVFGRLAQPFIQEKCRP